MVRMAHQSFVAFGRLMNGSRGSPIVCGLRLFDGKFARLTNRLYAYDPQSLLKNSSTFSTIRGLPQINGMRWCNSSGWISRIRREPSVAFPFACSVMKAIGLASYNNRSFPFLYLVLCGYR